MDRSAVVARKRPRSMTVAAIVAMVFGLATLQSGGMVLFGPDEARRAVWTAIAAGACYVYACPRWRSSAAGGV